RAISESRAGTERLTTKQSRAAARRADVPGGPVAQTPASLAGASSAGNHRFRPALERGARAIVPHRGVAQLRQEEKQAPGPQRHSRHAARSGARPLALVPGLLAAALPRPHPDSADLGPALPPPLDLTAL